MTANTSKGITYPQSGSHQTLGAHADPGDDR
jgi:hypothetical protein